LAQVVVSCTLLWHTMRSVNVLVVLLFAVNAICSLLTRLQASSRTLFVQPAFPRFQSSSRHRSLHARYAKVPKRNPFDILSLPRGASEVDVRAQFRKLAKKYHPDVPVTGDKGKFQEFAMAVEQLSTAEGRDEAAKAKTEPTGTSSWAKEKNSERTWDESDFDDSVDSLTDDDWGYYGKGNPNDMNLGNDQRRYDKSIDGQAEFDGWFDEVIDKEYKTKDDYWEREGLFEADQDEQVRTIEDEVTEDDPAQGYDYDSRRKQRLRSALRDATAPSGDGTTMADWVHQKKMRRLVAMRQKLRGRSAKKKRRKGAIATVQTYSKVRSTLANCLGRPISGVQAHTELVDIGFFQLNPSIMEIMKEMELFYRIDILEVGKDKQVKFEMPREVETVQDFANWIESYV